MAQLDPWLPHMLHQFKDSTQSWLFLGGGGGAWGWISIKNNPQNSLIFIFMKYFNNFFRAKREAREISDQWHSPHLASNKVGSDAKDGNAMPLLLEGLEDCLIDIVTGHNVESFHIGVTKGLTCLIW